jgi:hypothetical protein
MTDVFFSYSSKDRERVRPVRDALAAQGFEVFWDQQVPAGVDWDTWIRQHLASCKCAMVFWSSASITSRNVRHEAMVASEQGKLIPVLLEPLTTLQFPMGLYAQQAANLADWNGDVNHEEWDKLRREYEAKLMPQWVRQRMDEKDAELVAERARREGAERRDKILQNQIAKEAQVQQDLKRELNNAADEVVALKATVGELSQARADAEEKHEEGQRERNSALNEVAALKKELTQVRQSKTKEIARSIGATLSPLVIAAAVATVGFWTYQLFWPAPQPLPAVISDSMPEAEQQRLREEVQRQTKATADADAKRRAAEAEQQRLAAKSEEERKATAAVTKGLFEIRRNMEAQWKRPTDVADFLGVVASVDECQQKCTQSATCNAFAFGKANKYCHSYSDAEFVPNTNFDSGVRQSRQTPVQ